MTGEELLAVNNELKLKLEAISRAHSDLQTLMSARENELVRQKRLIEFCGEPLFVWDFENGIVEWNRGCEEFYGYGREEALSRAPDELLGIDKVLFETAKDQLRKHGSWSGERVHRTKDGRAVVVETRLQLESVDGRGMVLERSHDISHRKQWETRQTLLLYELSHRVKNTLAVVQAIAHQTLRHSPSPNSFVERFDGRLAALANAHNLLMQSNWQGADLEALARAQFSVYLADGAERVRMQGEAVALPADFATPFGLVLHELATNAAKHGALSYPNGTVDLRWSVSPGANRVLQLVWQESGGPPIQEGVRPGLGSRLIDTAIPESAVTRAFPREGLVCTIRVPIVEGSRQGSNDG